MERFIFLLACLLAPLAAEARLQIFACEPEWAALGAAIGGDLVETHSATTAAQDPHYIQARPSLIAKVRNADLVVCSGSQLEIGWLPALLQKANNRKVLPGSPGYMEASSFVQRIDAHGEVDRSKGDIHPLGNPHVQGDPRNIAVIARVLAARLAQIDSANSENYQQNLKQFLEKWQVAIADWETRAAGLAGMRVITHHRSWAYLERWLGLVEVANLEAVPGVPPTAAHLSRLTREFGDGGADVIIRSAYQDAKASAWLSRETGIPAIVLPLTVGGTDVAGDLYGVFDDIIARLQEAQR